MIKPQPEHSPEDLARIERIPAGAQSEFGKAAIRGLRDPLGRMGISPRRPERPAPRETRPRRRWR